MSLDGLHRFRPGSKEPLPPPTPVWQSILWIILMSGCSTGIFACYAWIKYQEGLIH